MTDQDMNSRLSDDRPHEAVASEEVLRARISLSNLNGLESFTVLSVIDFMKADAIGTRAFRRIRAIWTRPKTPRHPVETCNIRIKNFGQMDERFYRGGQPRATDYRHLAALGINTVINLRDDPRSNEQAEVETLGMRYISIPTSDTKYPRLEQIDEFLKLVGASSTGKFFVHCSGGRHRTGVIGAVYRFTVNHWNYDQVYSEMKSYDFYTRWGHGVLKQFVQEYWRQLQLRSSDSLKE